MKGEEYINDIANQVGTCRDQAVNSGHRCTGARGGPPDLVAWDLIEQLHALIQ